MKLFVCVKTLYLYGCRNKCDFSSQGCSKDWACTTNVYLGGILFFFFLPTNSLIHCAVKTWKIQKTALVISFRCCDKQPERNDLRKGMLSSAPWAWDSWPHPTIRKQREMNGCTQLTFFLSISSVTLVYGTKFPIFRVSIPFSVQPPEALAGPERYLLCNSKPGQVDHEE